MELTYNPMSPGYIPPAINPAADPTGRSFVQNVQIFFFK